RRSLRTVACVDRGQSATRSVGRVVRGSGLNERAQLRPPLPPDDGHDARARNRAHAGRSRSPNTRAGFASEICGPPLWLSLRRNYAQELPATARSDAAGLSRALFIGLAVCPRCGLRSDSCLQSRICEEHPMKAVVLYEAPASAMQPVTPWSIWECRSGTAEQSRRPALPTKRARSSDFRFWRGNRWTRSRRFLKTILIFTCLGPRSRY